MRNCLQLPSYVLIAQLPFKLPKRAKTPYDGLDPNIIKHFTYSTPPHKQLSNLWYFTFLPSSVRTSDVSLAGEGEGGKQEKREVEYVCVVNLLSHLSLSPSHTQTHTHTLSHSHSLLQYLRRRAGTHTHILCSYMGCV